MKFKSQGKRSKAWWLQAIKWFGKDGSSGIMHGAEVPTYQVRDAVKDLERARLVTVEGQAGKGFKPKFYLTSEGHRYLNEHPDELLEILEDREQPKLPDDSHPVPKYPNKPLQSIPDVDEPAPIDPDKISFGNGNGTNRPPKRPTPEQIESEKIVRHGISGDKAAPNTSENTSGSKGFAITITSEIVEMTENVDLELIHKHLFEGNRLFQILTFPEIKKMIFIFARGEEVE